MGCGFLGAVAGQTSRGDRLHRIDVIPRGYGRQYTLRERKLLCVLKMALLAVTTVSWKGYFVEIDGLIAESIDREVIG